jgi:hypothetical protein
MTDLNGRLFERIGGHLVPADIAAEEFVQSLPEHKKILLDHREPRHPENHAHFFAIIHAACEQLDYADEDELLDAVKMAVNHVRPIRKFDGEIIFLPKSINFASMAEDKFQRFKNRALYVLAQLLGVDSVTLLKEIK